MTSSMARGFREFAKMNNHQVFSGYAVFRGMLALAVLQTVLAEIIQRSGIYPALAWISSNLLIFALNCFLALLVGLFFLSLTGSLRATVILSTAAISLFALASLVKKQLLGEPLFPWDFLRLDQVWNLLPQYSGEIPLILLILGVISVALVVAGKLWIPAFQAKWRFRIAILLFICALTPALVFYRHTPLEHVFNSLDVQPLSWAQNENSLQNGFLLGFTLNLEGLLIIEPEGYQAAEIERIMAGASQEDSGPNPENRLGSKPNIVFVLNESFWDPTLLPDLNFSRDPVPFFRELRHEYPSGTMISPVFGGSTANVEFEILTGLSTTFLPQGAIAYQLYIDRELPAVPGLFQANGYRTTAIHPYHDWFYKRDTVLPLLGFDRFYSLKDFPDAQIKGDYISDLDVSKKIISELEDSSEPAFVFAVTMQNHGPYSKDRYLDTEISVDGPISAQGREILETYTQGVTDGDQSLRVLLAEVSELNEPTAVVFVGDHLPYLGKNYLVYRESGFIPNDDDLWSLADQYNMKSVPYVVWTNYNAQVHIPDRLSSQFMGNTLLDLAGMGDSFPFTFTRDFAGQLPVYGKAVNMEKNGRTFRDLPESLQTLADDYRLLQYDILFGEQYYLNYLEKEGA